MHETALVHGLVDNVLEHAQSIGATEVKAVYLTIGEGRDIVEEYLTGLFAFLTKGTVAEGAQLVIRHVPYTARCNQCGKVFPLDIFDPSKRSCPHCHTERDYKLYTGMEFMINQIQIVRDVQFEAAS